MKALVVLTALLLVGCQTRPSTAWSSPEAILRVVLQAGLIFTVEHEGRLPRSLEEFEDILPPENRSTGAHPLRQVVWVAPAGTVYELPASVVVAIIPVEGGVYVGYLGGNVEFKELNRETGKDEKTEVKERQPNQALQTTSVTRSGFGKVSFSGRQRRGV